MGSLGSAACAWSSAACSSKRSNWAWAIIPSAATLSAFRISASIGIILLVAGEMVDAQRALEIGLVDELAPIDEVPLRARDWLANLLALPRKPMLATRAIARAGVVDALRPELLELDRFVASWNDPDTQAALRALVARLGK